LLWVRAARDSIAYDQRCSCSSYVLRAPFAAEVGAAVAAGARDPIAAVVAVADSGHRPNWQLEDTALGGDMGWYGVWTATAPDCW